MTTTNLSPAEIDTQLARIWTRQQMVRYCIADSKATLAKYGENRSTEMVAASLVKLEAELDSLNAEAEPFEVEYQQRRWARYFLVTNRNGHVHRGMNCTTCYQGTAYGWLPELSDCVEADAIIEFGEKMCTVCFPDAPVHPAFSAPGRRDVAAKAERDAEKALRAAAKSAKLLAPGTEFRYEREHISTVAAAMRVLRETAALVAGFGYEHMMPAAPEGLAAAREALAAKGLVPVEIEQIERKAVVKARKVWG